VERGESWKRHAHSWDVLKVEPAFGDWNKLLSAEWKELDPDLKRNYPVNGKLEAPQELDKDVLADQEEHHKRKRRKLWNNMKNEVFNSQFVY
jgi:hypothetical protein